MPTASAVRRTRRPPPWTSLQGASHTEILTPPELGEGTTGQTELNRGKLAGLAFVVPPRQILDAFDASTMPIRMRFAGNEHQAQTLAALRDTLLPRLISGQLRLPKAEAELEAA